MDRREFLVSAATTTATSAAALPPKVPPGYASPARAMSGPREKFVFVTCSYVGTNRWESDYLASIDVDPESPNYSKIVSRLAMPVPGDDLFHFGWNVCSSSQAASSRSSSARDSGSSSRAARESTTTRRAWVSKSRV